MSKNKKNKVTIKGFIPVGLSRDVSFYFSRTQEKFVDRIDKLFIGDLYDNKKDIDLEKIHQDYPLVDSMRGTVKIKLSIWL
jgi:hypothetical protein